MALPETISHFLKRPGMYVNPDDYNNMVSFLNGFDSATNGGLLVGFREWLIVKVGSRNNLVWSSLVLFLTFPGSQDLDKELKRSRGQSKAITKLEALLEEFETARSGNLGLRGIYHSYNQWLHTQDWYGPAFPDWIEK